MFLQASVILSTGGEGVCLSACWDTPPQTTPPQEQTPTQTRHPPGSRRQHTVNERPVRILLECILVFVGIDHLLSQHIAHLFIRDPISLFSEKINQNDECDVDHFEV